MSNLYIQYNGVKSTPIPPQSTTNNFPVDITLAASGNVVIDVYADIGTLATITNTNTTPQTFTRSCATTCTTPATASTAASSASVFSGTNAGQTASIAVNGHTVTATTVGTAQGSADAIVNALNSDATITAGWTVSDNSSTTVTLTRLTAGSAGNFTVVTSAGTDTFTTAVSPTVNGANGNTQVDTLTPANVEVGDVFTAGIGSTSVSFTATAATAINVGDNIITLWNANSTLYALAHATGTDTGTVILTSTTAGTAGAFTSVVSAANGSHSAVGLVVQVTLSMSATGTTSNSTVTSSPATLAGQTMTVQSGSLALGSAITSDSPASQFIVGGTTGQQLATYSFTASNGTAVIDELKFSVTASAGAPIASLTVNGITAIVNSGVVDLNGLNITVPVSYSATNVPVLANWNPVGLGNQPTAQTASITTTYLKYHVGNTTTINTSPGAVSSNTMYAVASLPTITSTAQSHSIVLGENKLMDVTIQADSHGPVQLNTIVFTNAISGSTANIGSLAPRLAIGNTTLTGTGYSCSGTTTVTCSFPNNYVISAGQAKTFSLYGTVSGTLGSAGTTSLTSTLSASSTFSWTDVSGAASPSAITGGTNTTYLQNWPTAVWTAAN